MAQNIRMSRIYLLITILIFTCSFTYNSSSASNGEDLFKAVTSKDLKLVKKLVEKKGADVNYVRRINDAFYIPVLMQAVMDNSTDIATFLIHKGADVNATDGFKMTCLMWAANHGNIDVVHLLLDKGADKSAEDQNGMTALSAAENKGHKEIIEILKKN